MALKTIDVSHKLLPKFLKSFLRNVCKPIWLSTNVKKNLKYFLSMVNLVTICLIVFPRDIHYVLQWNLELVWKSLAGLLALLSEPLYKLQSDERARGKLFLSPQGPIGQTELGGTNRHSLDLDMATFVFWGNKKASLNE